MALLSNGEYLDDNLISHLNVLIDDLEQDDDNLIVIYGDEGSGKSCLVSQLIYYINSIDKDFNVKKNVHYIGSEYIESCLNGVKKQKNVLDESRRTLSKMRMMSTENQEFMNFLAECRSNNQWHFIVLPSYFDVDKDVALRRLKLLIKVIKYRHPITKRLIKGNFQIIDMKNKTQIKHLYERELHEIPSNMVAYEGKFTKWWGWDELEYKNKKEEEKKKYYIKTQKEDKKSLNGFIKFLNSNENELKQLIRKTLDCSSDDDNFIKIFNNIGFFIKKKIEENAKD